MSIKTALITAAGYGSRFFPISKSVQKEMLPILNRPVVDYLVEDCIKAGIEHIILVVRAGDHLVEHFYTEQPRILEQLRKLGTEHKYDALANLHAKAHFTFTIQQDDDGVPVKNARTYLEHEEAFLYLTGDDFMYHPNGQSEAAELISLYEKTKSPILSARAVAPDQTHRYGIVETEERDGYKYLKSMIEKPKQGTTSSNLANISKYILTKEVFTILDKQAVDSASKELYITDTVSALSNFAPVAVHVPCGEYLDCGSVAGWLRANLWVARQDKELWKQVTEGILT